MSGSLIQVERDGRVAHVILNRPERRNALTGPLVDELSDTIAELNADESVGVMLLRGAGRAFCSGLDLKEFGTDPQPDWVPGFGAKWRGVHQLLFDSPHAIVGALERAAVNGGAALALACDFLIVGVASFLQVGEVQQGMAAPMNMAWLKLRHSEAVAARVALLGDRIEGDELVSLGIAFAAVDETDVVSSAEALAARIAAHDAAGIPRIKTGVRRVGLDVDAATWFAQALEADPLAGRRMRPIAATDT